MGGATQRPYELDDLTFGVLWAITNLDEALLADDAALAESLPRLSPYEQMTSSSVSQDAAAGLTPISQGWLGSDFCARHIIRHLADFTDAPVFWTQEQRGEEACTWLFYRHKLNYLRHISERYAGGPIGRAFCVPEDVAARSPLYERILLFLSIALMESLNIRIWLCTDPAYSQVQGFALHQGKQAVVATWVRTSGIWHVDTTNAKPTLTDFTDAIAFAQASQVTQPTTPQQRLTAVASHLNLDLGWLATRCHALSRHGWHGLARPHSRLLTLDGLTLATTYLGQHFRPGKPTG